MSSGGVPRSAMLGTTEADLAIDALAEVRPGGISSGCQHTQVPLPGGDSYGLPVGWSHYEGWQSSAAYWTAGTRARDLPEDPGPEFETLPDGRGSLGSREDSAEFRRPPLKAEGGASTEFSDSRGIGVRIALSIAARLRY